MDLLVNSLSQITSNSIKQNYFQKDSVKRHQYFLFKQGFNLI